MAKLTSLERRIPFQDTRIAAPLPQSVAFNDPRRGTAAERGYGWQWRKLRKVILRRDGYQCAQCRREGILNPADEVDHIVAKARGGDDEPANLQSLCKPHHAAKTKAERFG